MDPRRKKVLEPYQSLQDLAIYFEGGLDSGEDRRRFRQRHRDSRCVRKLKKSHGCEKIERGEYVMVHLTRISGIVK